MKKLLGILVAALAVVVLVGVGIVAFSNSSLGVVSDVAEEAKVSATNVAIDASGIKDQVKTAIEEHKGTIASMTGLSTEQVDGLVSQLNIDAWQAATLPSNATEASTIDGSYAGIDGSITTYSDPEYVTVTAYGQEVTLAVPESAQGYLPLLSMAQ